MRIAFYHNLPSGGALRVTEKQVSELCKSHEIDCFRLSSASDASQALDVCFNNVNVYGYHLEAPHRHGRLQPIAWLRDLRRMASVSKTIGADIDSGSYDVCLTVTCPYFEMPFLHSHVSVPTLYLCHSSTYPSLQTLRPDRPPRTAATRNPFARRFDRELAAHKLESARRANMIAANSLFSREELFRLYGVNSYLLYPAVDMGLFHPEPGIARERAILGVGALAPFKAHDLSVRAAGRIPHPSRPELWIVYHTALDGEKEYLVHLAQALGVSLKLIADISPDELRELYNRAAVTVFPSIFEPLGLVPLESMACGTPVVGVAEGGTRETVTNGVTGLLTNRDADAFAEAISTLLDKPDYAVEMGKAGLASIREKWTWERSIADLEKLLAKVVSMAR